MPETLYGQNSPGFLVLDPENGFMEFQELNWDIFHNNPKCFAFSVALGKIFCAASDKLWITETVKILCFDEVKERWNFVEEIEDLDTYFGYDDFHEEIESVAMEAHGDKLFITQQTKGYYTSSESEAPEEKNSYVHILKLSIEDGEILCFWEKLLCPVRDSKLDSVLLEGLYILEL